MLTATEVLRQINETCVPSKEFLKSIDNTMRDFTMADWKYEKIMEQIEEFEAQLDDNHEVAIQMVPFDVTKIMIVHRIAYQNPDLLYFHGTINGNSAQLIQHISQLNFLLVSVLKEDPESSPRRIAIGFRSSRED